jgi:hypothetical protein
MVPHLVLSCGLEIDHVQDPAAAAADLVLVHTLHPDIDHGWVADHPIVLDATYRLDVEHCEVP